MMIGGCLISGESVGVAFWMGRFPFGNLGSMRSPRGSHFPCRRETQKDGTSGSIKDRGNSEIPTTDDRRQTTDIGRTTRNALYSSMNQVQFSNPKCIFLINTFKSIF